MSSEQKYQAVQFPPGEPARSLRISIIEGAFATLNIAVTSSALMMAYALMLGANFYHQSLLFGLTALSSVGQLFGSRLVGIYSDRRKITVFASVGGMVDIDFADLIDYLGEDDQTRAILVYMERLAALDVEGVPPMTHAVALDCPLREDAPGEQLGTEAALRGAPRRDGDFFQVPRVIAHDKEA